MSEICKNCGRTTDQKEQEEWIEAQVEMMTSPLPDKLEPSNMCYHCLQSPETEKRKNLRKDLQIIINCHGQENSSNTPDFILADYIIDCLEVFNKTVENRMKWEN